jgi:hypothetical protein
MTRKVVVLLVLALVATACNTDPTTSEEFLQLSEEMATVESDLTDAQAAVSAATAAAEEADREKASELERREEAEAPTAAAEARFETIAASLDRARELLGVEASYVLTDDPDAIAELPAETLALREELAALIGWFDTAEEYNLAYSFRSFNRASGVIEESNVAPMNDAWNDFWDADLGTIEETVALLDYQVWQMLTVIEALDDALAEAVLDEG